nr:MAG: hypothetical protein A2V48_00445 [Candidatus Amesbacteria bacterium RBG_19FT_COMBO_48_16]
MKTARDKQQLLELIKRSAFSGPGNARFIHPESRDFSVYQDIPFPGFNQVNIQRQNDTRIDLILDHLNVSGKKVLDIGCNIGSISFRLNQRGAYCVGIDADADSIRVASSLKRIHHVKGVEFYHRPFNSSALDFLSVRHGQFDIILLLSVYHWLLYEFGSSGPVITLLNRLSHDHEQSIIYEPSFSSYACFPDTTTPGAIDEFFESTGCYGWQRVGQSFASNSRRTRGLWLGKRNLNELCRTIGNKKSDYRGFPIVLLKSTPKKDTYKWRYLTVTKSESARPGYFLFKNESSTLLRLSALNLSFLPQLVSSRSLSGSDFVVSRFIRYPSLDQLYSKKLIPAIRSRLYEILAVFKKLGLTHNDIIPRNIFFDPVSSRLILIDYEFCLPAGTDPEHSFSVTRKDVQLLLSQSLRTLGSKFRNKSVPLFSFANDRVIVNRVISDYYHRRFKDYLASRLRNYQQALIRYLSR